MLLLIFGRQIVSSSRPGRRKAGSNTCGISVVANTTNPLLLLTLSIITSKSVIISNFADKLDNDNSANRATLALTEYEVRGFVDNCSPGKPVQGNSSTILFGFNLFSSFNSNTENGDVLGGARFFVV